MLSAAKRAFVDGSHKSNIAITVVCIGHRAALDGVRATCHHRPRKVDPNKSLIDTRAASLHRVADGQIEIRAQLCICALNRCAHHGALTSRPSDRDPLCRLAHHSSDTQAIHPTAAPPHRIRATFMSRCWPKRPWHSKRMATIPLRWTAYLAQRCGIFSGKTDG